MVRGPQGGRPPVSSRAVLTGILYVLWSGIPWRLLPREMGCGSGVTCWRRLRDWQQAGVWEQMHFTLLDWCAQAKRLDWRWAVLDSSSVRAVGAGEHSGPNPVDRRKPGSKRHVLTDAAGTPLTVILTRANRNDSQEALALLDGVPPLLGPRGGRPRCRPAAVLGDAAYGTRANRTGARQRGIVPYLAWQKEGHGSGLGRFRYVVERTMAWLNQFRRLRVRYERKAELYLAFLHLACTIICWRVLQR
jgi:transposase